MVFILVLLLYFFNVVRSESSEYKTLSNEGYKNALDIYLTSTDNSKKVGDEIQKRIESRFILPEDFLDIGPGNGRTHQLISGHFKKPISIVEPNEKFWALFEDNKGYIAHNLLFEEYYQKFSDQRFNFVLLSHVLYHIPESKWEDMIAQILSLLKPNGVLCIVMDGRLSEVYNYLIGYNPKYLPSLEKNTKTLEKNYDREFVRSDHVIETTKFEEMEIVVRFLVFEGAFTPSCSDGSFEDLDEEKKKWIEKKILADVKSMRRSNGKYSFGSKQEILFMKKKTGRGDSESSEL